MNIGAFKGGRYALVSVEPDESLPADGPSRPPRITISWRNR